MDLLKQIFDNTPDDIAIYYGNEKFSYQELNVRSDNVACFLANNGINRGDKVGVTIPKSPLLVEVVICLLKLGAVYVPIGIGSPKSRRNAILDQSECSIYLVDDHDKYSVKSMNIEEIKFSDYNKCQSTVEFGQRSNGVKNQSIYIIHTSGSTGIPKSVHIDSNNLNTFLYGMADSIGFNSKDRMSFVSDLAFDSSIMEIYLPLFIGGSIVVPVEKNLHLKDESIINNKANFVFVTPSLVSILPNTYENHSVRFIMVGGEPVEAECIDRVSVLFPNADIRTVYGTTETTVISLVSRCNLRYSNYSDKSYPMGQPIKGVEYTLHRNLNYPNFYELCLLGDVVSNAFFTKASVDDLSYSGSNDSSFVDCYRTGDLVSFVDGELFFECRLDDQVKILGKRISIRSVEASLLAIFEDINLRIYTCNSGSTELICFYTSEKYSLENERKKMESSMLHYSIPRKFYRVKEWPLNSSGKVSKEELFNMILNESCDSRLISDYIKNDLGLIQFDPTLDFYDNGIDSFNAQLIANHVNETFKTNLEIYDIYETPLESIISKEIINARVAYD